MIDRIVRSALVHEPGEAAVYGDLDFIALGALVEAVTQRRLDDYCRERVFEPLGLRETFFVPLGEGAGSPAPLRRRIAATENCPWRERILWGEVHDPNAWAMGGVAGHAGLFATADDVMRFAETCSTSGTGAATRCRARPLRPSRTPAAAEGIGLGARLGHADAGAVLVGPALLGALDRPPRLHRHLALDRSRARGDRGDAHEPRAPGRKKSSFELRPIVHDL